MPDTAKFSVDRAAKWLGVHPNSIRRAIRREQEQAGTGLKAAQDTFLRGSPYSISLEDLQEYRTSRTR